MEMPSEKDSAKELRKLGKAVVEMIIGRIKMRKSKHMAPDDAITLGEYGTSCPNWPWLCSCGAKGRAEDLLVDPSYRNESIWCPKCRCECWKWA